MRQYTKIPSSTSSTLKSLILVPLIYGSLYYGLRCCCPTFWYYYLKYNMKKTQVIPNDQPKKIRNAKEVFNVHSYDEALNYVHDVEEPIIFRNFSNCAEKFDNILYPRRKDIIDTFIKLNYSETLKGNAFRSSFIKRSERENVDLSLKQIFEEKSPYHFASFLRLFQQEDYRVLLNANENVTFKFDSSFISHFDRPVVSTEVHNAPLAQTFSVQCFGTKAWLFWSYGDTLKYGFKPDFSPFGIIMRGDHESIVRIPTVRAVVYANDVLYFPPTYYHAVSTSPGKNVMFAIRRIGVQAFQQAIKMTNLVTVADVLGRILFSKVYDKINQRRRKAGFKHNNFYEPFKSETALIKDELDSSYGSFDGLADFGLPTQ